MLRTAGGDTHDWPLDSATTDIHLAWWSSAWRAPCQAARRQSSASCPFASRGRPLRAKKTLPQHQNQLESLTAGSPTVLDDAPPSPPARFHRPCSGDPLKSCCSLRLAARQPSRILHRPAVCVDQGPSYAHRTSNRTSDVLPSSAYGAVSRACVY